MTDAERLLWRHLRLGQVCGYKFRRQSPVGKYIVDLDGSQHQIAKEKDFQRDAWLEGQGFQILRFWNNEVMTNMDGVLQKILQQVQSPHLSPPPQGGRR